MVKEFQDLLAKNSLVTVMMVIGFWHLSNKITTVNDSVIANSVMIVERKALVLDSKAELERLALKVDSLEYKINSLKFLRNEVVKRNYR